MTEIRNNLVCQVCEDPARPGKRQWYRCMNLHQICQECKEKDKECSCGEPISYEYCKIFEQLLSVEGLEFNCINTKNGCKEAFVGNALGEHESECIYRLVRCPLDTLAKGNCEMKVTFHKVIQHYENQHLDETDEFLPCFDLSQICTTQMDKIDRYEEDSYRDPVKFTLNNQRFLMLEKTQDKVVYKWIYILGSSNEAKHFSYTLKLIGKRSKMSFEGKVAAIDESFDALFVAGKCFAIPRKALMAHLVDEDNEYEYSLEMKNLKEEVKDENNESGISDNDDDTKE